MLAVEKNADMRTNVTREFESNAEVRQEIKHGETHTV